MFKEGNSRTGKQYAENISGVTRKSEGLQGPLLSIDLGSRKIRAVAGIVDANEKVEIIRAVEVESGGITKGIITDCQSTAASILAAMEDITLFLSSELQGVFVGVSGHYVKRFILANSFVRKKPRQPITPQEVNGYVRQTLEQIVLPPGERLIHFYLQKFSVHGKNNPRCPAGLKGKKIEMELQVVTGQIADMDAIAGSMERAGLEVTRFIPSYMASAEAVLSEAEKDEGVAVLDIGFASTHITIYCDGCLRYACIIPFGSGIITEDIKEGFFIIRKEAELLKVKAGSALSDKVMGNEISTVCLKGEPKEVPVRNLARIIQARMEEILDMAMLEIKNSGFKSGLKKGIVLAGGGAQLKNLELLVSQHTGFPCRIGYPVERLAGGMDMDFRNPVYATGLGLLIKGYDSLKFNV